MRLGVWLSAMLVAGAALADPSPSELAVARDLFAQAQKDEDAQQWGPALEKLKRVAAIKVTPGVRSHIAACEEKLGQLVLALADYESAEALARQQGNAEVLAAIAEPMAKLKARVPTLTITAPPNAAVMLDEKRLAPGALGVALPIDPGAHRVDARAPGKPAYGATVRVKERDAVALEVKFADGAPPPPEPPKTEPPKTEPPSASPTAEPPADAPRPEGAMKSGSLVPGIVAAGGAVGLVALGIGAFAAAGGAQGDLEAQCAASVACPDDKKGAVHAWDTVALLSWIGAAGLAGLSVYFFVRSGSAKSEASLVVGPGSVGLRGVF